MREFLSAYSTFFSVKRYRNLLVTMTPVLLVASTYLGWVRGGGAPDVVLKWLQPETSEAASLYVPSPDPAPLTASAAGPRPTRLAEQALASAPNLGAAVISFRRSPGGVPLANTTTEASGSD